MVSVRATNFKYARTKNILFSLIAKAQNKEHPWQIRISILHISSNRVISATIKNKILEKQKGEL